MQITLVLGGAVGAMAFGAVMVFVSRRSDLVALWLGCFLACIAAQLLVGGAPGSWLGLASLPFFAAFVAELNPGPWPRRVAAAVALAGIVSGIAGALALTQALACGLAGWATFVSLRLVRERHNTWPLVIMLMAITYPVLTLGALGLEGLEPAGFVAYVLAPGVILTRRAIRAFDAEARRALDQAKFTADALDSVPVALSMRGLDGRYQFVNRTWEKYYGYKRDNVLGTSPRDRATEAEAAALLAMDRLALEAGPGQSTPPMDYALGDRRYLHIRTAMADSRGKLLGVLTASIDITDRKAMEQALAMEQQRLALMVHSSKLGLLDWDGKTRTAYYSPRFKEILGYSAGADTSKWPDYFDLLHPDDAERVRKRFREHIIDSREDFHEALDYRLRRADGRYVWVQAQGVSVRDEKGFATRFIATLTDITQRRAQEEALRESVRLREEVERMSRHDLKTPLNSVIAVSRLLRQGGKLSPEDEELLSIVERAGYRILSMVNLSLDLYRMESGTYQFRAQSIDLSEVARKVAADLESQAASKEVVIDLRQSGRSLARAEELLCYSLLANLVKNAIEASPERGTVTVTVEGAGDTVGVHVHNAGVIAPEVRPRFFEKYATSGKSDGLGLGAYSARLMARVQEGEITLHTTEAAGTTVSVRLRAAQQASEAREPAAPTGTRAERLPVLPALKVLVVDDDEFNRLVFRRMLPSPPLSLTMAVNGRAALEAAKNDFPDVVFLDLEMPVMDGYEAAGRLRKLAHELRKPCRIVAISSNDDDRTIARALNAGCDDYLVKPAPRETLWSVIAGEAIPAAAGGEAPARESDAVLIDADLRGGLAEFRRTRHGLLDQMGEALRSGDRRSFGRIAHKLSGSFSLYGFRWAAAQCRALQGAAESAEPGELGRAAAAVRRHLDTAAVE